MQMTLTVKKIQGIANLTISVDLHFSKTLFLDIGRPCNLLTSIIFQNFISERPTQHPVRSKTQQFQLIYTGVIST